MTVDVGSGWTKLTAEITATGEARDGWFALKGSVPGTVVLDVVSLFPPTYKGRDNGCRIDLAEKLEAMKPSFVRFPGGCYVEGIMPTEKPTVLSGKTPSAYRGTSRAHEPELGI